MSIASEITRINTNIASAYTACSNKGATMPVTQNSANLASTIATISGGGGGGSLQTKSVTINSNGTTTVLPDVGYDGMTTVTVTTDIPTTQYVVAASTLFTLTASEWIGDAYSISLTGYTVDTSKLQIGIPINSSANNTLNIVNAGLSIYGSTSTYIDIKAVNVPTSDIQILIFGVEVTS